MISVIIIFSLLKVLSHDTNVIGNVIKMCRSQCNFCVWITSRKGVVLYQMAKLKGLLIPHKAVTFLFLCSKLKISIMIAQSWWCAIPVISQPPAIRLRHLNLVSCWQRRGDNTVKSMLGHYPCSRDKGKPHWKLWMKEWHEGRVIFTNEKKMYITYMSEFLLLQWMVRPRKFIWLLASFLLLSWR
jgi:hypothetical protein